MGVNEQRNAENQRITPSIVELIKWTRSFLKRRHTSMRQSGLGGPLNHNERRSPIWILQQ